MRDARRYLAAPLRVLLGVLAVGCVTLPAAAAELPQGEGFVDVPGGPVWYRVTGDGDGLPLLVLHGGPGGTSCGFARLDPLGAERPVIRYDQLGTGRSGRPEDPSLWHSQRFVDALDVLIDELGLQDFHLLGHSWGGALAAAYLLDKGTSGVRSVVLSSPLLSTPDWIEDANFLRGRLPQDVQDTLARHEAAGTIDSDEYRDASMVFYERHVFGGPRVAPPDACDGVSGNSYIYNFMWGPTEFNATGNLVDFDVTDRLHELDIPVLLLAGEFDEARPERLAQYQQIIPGAELVVIKDAAHGTLSRKPEIYRATIETFFDRVESTNRE